MPEHDTSPISLNIPPNAIAYICDFGGWSACLIKDPDLIHDYANKYHLSIKIDDHDTSMTIWCWKPQYATPCTMQKAGVLGTQVAMEAQWSD